MALFQGNIFPRTLGFETQVFASFPYDGRRYRKMGPEKTLLLLHGISDNASGWIRYGLADALAQKYNIAVVIPEGHKSFWLDMEYGGQYATYLTGELPELMGRMFRIPTDGSHLMIAGLSMGGYGALHAALLAPEAFCAAGAFSGVMDIRRFVENAEVLEKTSDCGPNFRKELPAVFGQKGVPKKKDELSVLAEAVEEKRRNMPIYLAWGEEDVLVREQNQKFSEYLTQRGFSVTCEAWPGVHDWTFWNAALEHFLEKMVGTPEPDNVFGGVSAYQKQSL